MKEKVNYFKCPTCGNIIEVINGDINRVKCCNKELELLIANTNDGSVEKHVPVYEIVNNEVIIKVGETIHPMEDKHYIMWISLVTNDKIIRITLKPGDEPIVRLPYTPKAIIYEYCNLHGLWKTVIE